MKKLTVSSEKIKKLRQEGFIKLTSDCICLLFDKKERLLVTDGSLLRTVCVHDVDINSVVLRLDCIGNQYK